MSIKCNGDTKGHCFLNEETTFVFENGICSIKYKKGTRFEFFKTKNFIIITKNGIQIKLSEEEFINNFEDPINLLKKVE